MSNLQSRSQQEVGPRCVFLRQTQPSGSARPTWVQFSACPVEKCHMGRIVQLMWLGSWTWHYCTHAISNKYEFQVKYLSINTVHRFMLVRKNKTMGIGWSSSLCFHLYWDVTLNSSKLANKTFVVTNIRVTLKCRKYRMCPRYIIDTTDEAVAILPMLMFGLLYYQRNYNNYEQIPVIFFFFRAALLYRTHESGRQTYFLFTVLWLMRK